MCFKDDYLACLYCMLQLVRRRGPKLQDSVPATSLGIAGSVIPILKLSTSRANAKTR